jgi:hypothetical protein
MRALGDPLRDRSDNERVKPPLVIRSDIALAGWAFMAIWCSGMVLVTLGYAAAGAFHQFDPLIEAGVLMLFWVFTLAGLAELGSKPRTRLTLDGAGAVLVRIWPMRRREDRIPGASLASIVVGAERDNDGDLTYRLDLVLPSGEEVSIRQSADREELEKLREQILAAVPTTV